MTGQSLHLHLFAQQNNCITILYKAFTSIEIVIGNAMDKTNGKNWFCFHKVCSISFLQYIKNQVPKNYNKKLNLMQ